jgi:hypothetical protein
MRLETNTLYIANPLRAMMELDSDQFELVYFDLPHFEINLSNKDDITVPYNNFEEYLTYIAGIIFQSHRLLTPQGSILVRIDPSSLFNARLFLDRVFGKENFRGELIWEKPTPRKPTSLSSPNMNFESLFFYSKGDKFIYNEPYREMSDDELRREYSHKDKRGYYKLWKLIDKTERSGNQFEWKEYKPPKGSSWRYAATQLTELDKKGEIDFSSKLPRRKVYLDEASKRVLAGLVWHDLPARELKQFQFDPRIKRAIEMVSNFDSKLLFLPLEIITVNTVRTLNLEYQHPYFWVGISPNDLLKKLVSNESKASSLFSQRLRDSNLGISIFYLGDNQQNAVRDVLPANLQRLINGESQTVISHVFPKAVGQKYAFLVGINRYTSDFQPLNYCVNDAMVLSETFQKLDYSTKTLHDDLEDSTLNPNKSNIETELIDLVNSLNPDDTLFVHFSCHGTVLEDQAFLITSDTRRRRIRQTAVSMQEIIDVMKAARAKKLVLSLDVCHGGVEMGRALIDDEFIHNVYINAEGFALIAASTARQQAYETHEHKHGLFTYFLIKGLSGDADINDDGIISVSELNDYLLDEIRRWNLCNGGVQTPTFRTEGIGDIPLVIQ